MASGVKKNRAYYLHSLDGVVGEATANLVEGAGDAGALAAQCLLVLQDGLAELGRVGHRLHHRPVAPLYLGHKAQSLYICTHIWASWLKYSTYKWPGHQCS